MVRNCWTLERYYMVASHHVGNGRRISMRSRAQAKPRLRRRVGELIRIHACHRNRRWLIVRREGHGVWLWLGVWVSREHRLGSSLSIEEGVANGAHNARSELVLSVVINRITVSRWSLNGGVRGLSVTRGCVLRERHTLVRREISIG